jgi:hypothetical protein
MIHLLKRKLLNRLNPGRDGNKPAQDSFGPVPVKLKHTDLYLVEFPKSGITWLSFLLANLEVRISGIEKEINFFNIIDYVADIHGSIYINEKELPGFGCRLIKSHSEFNPKYTKLIYLVRDPRTVMISYFYFLKNLGIYQNGISEFIRDNRYGAACWNRHVHGWVNQSVLQQKIIFVRYEDLHTGPVQLLNNIVKYLGLNIQPEKIQEAVNASSFENMRNYEEMARIYDVRRGKSGKYNSFEFVRKGEINYQELSENDIEYVNTNCREMMQLFGYI